MGEGGAGDNQKRRSVFKRQVMTRSGSPLRAEDTAEGETDGAMRCGASKKRRSELPAAHPGGSKGDRIARTGPTVAVNRAEKRVCRFRQSRLRHTALGARADVGALRGPPRSNGERETLRLPRGESHFPSLKNRLTMCQV